MDLLTLRADLLRQELLSLSKLSLIAARGGAGPASAFSGTGQLEASMLSSFQDRASKSHSLASFSKHTIQKYASGGKIDDEGGYRRLCALAVHTGA